MTDMNHKGAWRCAVPLIRQDVALTFCHILSGVAQKAVHPHSGFAILSGPTSRLKRSVSEPQPGAQMNDLRFHGNALYITDSGLGGIIVHDMTSGKTQRRLSGKPVVKVSDKAPPAMLSGIKGGKTFHPPNSDMIEITADGKWLYWAAPSGETRVIASDARLLRPDGTFISADRQLYIPVKQPLPAQPGAAAL